ncbi:hypothetical protein PTKIN_Ptkin16aG0524000 [Pterospermum kingtungense]
MEPSQSQASPYVLIFPLPIQGPVNAMLKLAELCHIWPKGDEILGFVLDVCNELRIPIINCCTVGACYLWSNYSIPDIIEAGELPIKGSEDMDRPVIVVLGMEIFLGIEIFLVSVEPPTCLIQLC